MVPVAALERVQEQRAPQQLGGSTRPGRIVRAEANRERDNAEVQSTTYDVRRPTLVSSLTYLQSHHIRGLKRQSTGES